MKAEMHSHFFAFLSGEGHQWSVDLNDVADLERAGEGNVVYIVPKIGESLVFYSRK
jgi:hypothetical protein